MLALSEILDDDLGDFVSTTKRTSKTPFPQANSLERVLALVNVVNLEGVETQKFIDAGIVNSGRQADYYANAAIYLGLVKKVGERYCPTGVGAKLKSAFPDRTKQSQMLAAIALAHPTISEVYSIAFMLETVEERKTMIASTVDMGSNVNAMATIMRRADSVYAWLVWIQRHLGAL